MACVCARATPFDAIASSNHNHHRRSIPIFGHFAIVAILNMLDFDFFVAHKHLQCDWEKWLFLSKMLHAQAERF